MSDGSFFKFMNSKEIRSSFLEFFAGKRHSILPSASLLPDSPNLLFTNAGMNQFVPIFLGQRVPDVDCWPGAQSGVPTRAADTQKCIRAGGKHNDLDDVGWDTYHQTFFEMLGNWSFGDYFKKEAIEWAWELVVDKWKFPASRLYATFYQPGPGEPSDRDSEACDHWRRLFQAAGLDSALHVRKGNKKDNFWMMGETGPCGPCSELHMDLTSEGNTRGNLVNAGDARCIEIWNLVFIQFNANPDGTFSSLPARHVDTGMGFERIVSIIQGTQGFTDFSRLVSNYDTDIFRPLLHRIEELSGKKYTSTLPGSGGNEQQVKADIAFRVIADHIRTLSFAIADGIVPGNNDRNYVLRRILRRAVRYGRTLGLHEPFFYKLAPVLSQSMGTVFPELISRQAQVEEVIRTEEEAFNRTLDNGLRIFTDITEHLKESGSSMISGEDAFRLSDTYGFPPDLTQLMAREIGFSVDEADFDRCMEQQRARARAAQKKETICVNTSAGSEESTEFLGYEVLECSTVIRKVHINAGGIAIALEKTPFYAEMGGQVGDSGSLAISGFTHPLAILYTIKSGKTFYHQLASETDVTMLSAGVPVQAIVDSTRRRAIECHHSVTHLLHWALHEVVSRDIAQKGSYVGPDKLTFDFNSVALSAGQIADVENLVNERIRENGIISWLQLPYHEIRGRSDIMQIFGDKYGETVRVVQIGGDRLKLNGYSMELCAGTHRRATGEIGFFRIVSEGAVASGVRRIEALAGAEAYQEIWRQTELIRRLAKKMNAPFAELERKLDATLAQSKILEKQLRVLRLKQATIIADTLLTQIRSDGRVPAIVENLGEMEADMLQSIADSLKNKFDGVLVLGSTESGIVSLIATVAPTRISQISAGNIIREIAPLVGGKGGGRPDSARGGGRDTTRLDEALRRANDIISHP